MDVLKISNSLKCLYKGRRFGLEVKLLPCPKKQRGNNSGDSLKERQKQLIKPLQEGRVTRSHCDNQTMRSEGSIAINCHKGEDCRGPVSRMSSNLADLWLFIGCWLAWAQQEIIYWNYVELNSMLIILYNPVDYVFYPTVTLSCPSDVSPMSHFRLYAPVLWYSSITSTKLL